MIGPRDASIYIAAMMADRYGHEGIRILSNGLPDEYTEKGLQIAKAYGMTIERRPITAVLGDAGKDGKGLEGFEVEGGDRIESTIAIVAMGAVVYSDLLRDLGGDLDPTGRPLVGPKFETSVPGFFAVGDLVPGRKMQVYTGWDEAVDAADEINARIRKEKMAARLAAVGG